MMAEPPALEGTASPHRRQQPCLALGLGTPWLLQLGQRTVRINIAVDTGDFPLFYCFVVRNICISCTFMICL